MKLLTLAAILLLQVFTLNAQITPANRAELARMEGEMLKHAEQILFGIDAGARFRADSIFTRSLVQALKKPHSFHYPFDSLVSVSRLYAPDSTFRIITWHLPVSENSVRQHGAIQMRTTDGSLKLFPLIDKSDVMVNKDDTITNHLAWYGALYYRIVMKELNGQPVYTLIGFDENNIRSNIKVIEILQFKDGEPVFGAPYFRIVDDKIKPGNITRYLMEYKRGAGARLNYDVDFDMIVKEHLISETNEPHKKYTYIGDGDYEAFKWMDGKWTYISKIFFEVTPEGQPPMPKKLLDDEGNVDEGVLQ